MTDTRTQALERAGRCIARESGGRGAPRLTATSITEGFTLSAEWKWRAAREAATEGGWVWKSDRPDDGAMSNLTLGKFMDRYNFAPD